MWPETPTERPSTKLSFCEPPVKFSMPEKVKVLTLPVLAEVTVQALVELGPTSVSPAPVPPTRPSKLAMLPDAGGGERCQIHGNRRSVTVLEYVDACTAVDFAGYACAIGQSERVGCSTRRSDWPCR